MIWTNWWSLSLLIYVYLYIINLVCQPQWVKVLCVTDILSLDFIIVLSHIWVFQSIHSIYPILIVVLYCFAPCFILQRIPETKPGYTQYDLWPLSAKTSWFLAGGLFIIKDEHWCHLFIINLMPTSLLWIQCQHPLHRILHNFPVMEDVRNKCVVFPVLVSRWPVNQSDCQPLGGMTLKITTEFLWALVWIRLGAFLRHLVWEPCIAKHHKAGPEILLYGFVWYHHCGCRWPGALAPGHLRPQWWHKQYQKFIWSVLWFVTMVCVEASFRNFCLPSTWRAF